jgi:hypothetical protein
MTTSKLRTALGCCLVVALLLLSVAEAAVPGVVTAVSKHDVTVSGAVYPVDAGVALEDMSRHPITWPEIRPGITVELEFDDEGRLVLIRANVVR